jgi:hypothetical protein
MVPYITACILPHQMYATKMKNIERLIQHIKDRTECFDNYFPCRKPECEMRHISNWLKSLTKPDEIAMLLEPFANDKLEDNLDPVDRLEYAASTTPFYSYSVLE